MSLFAVHPAARSALRSATSPSRPRLFSVSLLLCALLPGAALAQGEPATEERNKALARAFYEDLWFSDNTDAVGTYVADTYVAHDIGDRKNAVEPASRQKEIADGFWDVGTQSGSIDFQIAEGDLVATRWQWNFEPTTLLARLLYGRNSIPIINVMRFEDGKIVEFWNHRHDIDTARTRVFVAQGLGIGLIIALIPTLIAVRQRRVIREFSANS